MGRERNDDYDEASVYTDDLSRQTGVTTGRGDFVSLSTIVLYWTISMALSVLTILSYFTMVLLSLGSYQDAQGGERSLSSFLRSRRLGDDYVADDYVDDAVAADDDYAQGDDAIDDDAYAQVDDAIANDDDSATWDEIKDSFWAGNGGKEFSFQLSWQEMTYLVIVLVAIVGLDYYGLEALKELGNKAARFRVGGFASFILFLGQCTIAIAFCLGLTKSSDDMVGGGVYGSGINAVSMLFLLLSFFYIAFGLALFWYERSPLVSRVRREPILDQAKQTTPDRLFKFWLVLVVVAYALQSVAYTVFNDAKAQARHQSHGKLSHCMVWEVVAFTVVMILGMVTLKARGYSTKLMTGTFYGALVGLSLLCIVFGVFFISPHAVSISILFVPLSRTYNTVLLTSARFISLTPTAKSLTSPITARVGPRQIRRKNNIRRDCLCGDFDCIGHPPFRIQSSHLLLPPLHHQSHRR